MVGVVRDVVEEPRNSAPQPIDVEVTTDATAEGELVASALRARGFQVIDAPMAYSSYHHHPDGAAFDQNTRH